VNWLSELVGLWRAAGQKIGVVPTMGALHAGHLSLVKAARVDCDRVIATIFVNPTQFAPTEDLAKYPRTLGEDLELLAAEGVDAVLVPKEEEIYPPGFSTYVEPPAVARGWEGAARPTHFRGVATVVLKLLNMTRADICYLGQKDFQQVAVVRKMVADLNVPCEIRMCPTVRDPDGLAMSSRNRYLSPADRKIGLSLSRTLFAAERFATAKVTARSFQLGCTNNFAKLESATSIMPSLQTLTRWNRSASSCCPWCCSLQRRSARRVYWTTCW
jgi:pantoate--beta-alanine ligase